MKQLFYRLVKLAQVVLLLAVLAIVAGAPLVLVAYTSLFILDFAAIAWVENDARSGGLRARMPTPFAAFGIVSC